MASTNDLDLAREILEAEAKSILGARERLGAEFTKALDLMANAIERGGKVVVTGVGKSGKVASKVAATLSSTGTLAVFLHPTEAAHGDLGIVTKKDALLAFSQSGSSDEVLFILPHVKRLGVPVIAVVGKPSSPLAKQADVVINSHIEQEAGPLNLAPTSSTTVCFALGDAMALCLCQRWGFKEEHFAEIHPAGSLGRRLTLLVSDLMRSGSELGMVAASAGVDEVVAVSTHSKLGGVVVQEGDRFLGLITDGDIRRALGKKEAFFKLKAKDIMTVSPVHVSPDTKAVDALKLMENRPSQISVLPVLEKHKDGQTQCVGILRLHDLFGQI